MGSVPCGFAAGGFAAPGAGVGVELDGREFGAEGAAAKGGTGCDGVPGAAAGTGAATAGTNGATGRGGGGVALAVRIGSKGRGEGITLGGSFAADEGGRDGGC